ncbi:MAG TPA: type II toxin-antitoxin system Phd/YefM family antitoxin [Bdellovibrionota bacterium]|nr:type II toxin-antitoxin system Phd/YefM family antitoxin [Bdellovibrionota bacterium]
MIKLNIHQAKTHLSRYLARVLQGEIVLLCKRNSPIAEIRRLATKRTRRRPIGLAKNQFSIPKSFFDPLPSDVERGFRGEG